MLDSIVVPVIITPEVVNEAFLVTQHFTDMRHGQVLLSLNIDRDDMEFEIKMIRDETPSGSLAECSWAEVVMFDGGQEIALFALPEPKAVLDLALHNAPITACLNGREFVFKPARLPSCNDGAL